MRRLLSILALLPMLASGAASASPGQTVLVSVGPGGVQGNDHSDNIAIDADGGVVAFMSKATNLTTKDSEGFHQVYVRDVAAGTTTMVSVASDGTPGSADSGGASFTASGITIFAGDPITISADGNLVAFESSASNLVSGDTNGAPDVFVHDVQTGVTTRVDVTSDGSQMVNGAGATISGNGRYVAFLSQGPNLKQGQALLYVRDLQQNTTALVSEASDGTPANSGSLRPAISEDGTKIVFVSDATNLAPGIATNGKREVYLHDLTKGTTTMVSTGESGGAGNGDSFDPAISADGTSVAYQSTSTNLAARTPKAGGVFWRELANDTSSLVSVATSGQAASTGAGDPSISGNGNLVSFLSSAPNLGGSGHIDLFVRDIPGGTTTDVSRSPSGGPANDDSFEDRLSADGTFVAISGPVSNLVSNDHNGFDDVFRNELKLEVLHPRSVTLSLSGHLTATGKVSASDGFAGCASGAAVTVQRKQGSSWVTAGTGKTGATGAYRISLPNTHGSYRAKLALKTLSNHVDVCAAAVSPSRTH